MSTLRILGFIIGVLGLLATFLVYRGARWNRSNFIFLAFLNISLMLVTINPNILNVLRDAMSLQNAYRGRIIALLILSNIFLLFYIFFTKIKIDNIHLQFDRLVRSLGSQDVEQNVELIDCIKPAMVLIPAYNESDNLKELLPFMPQKIGGTEIGVLVVDDGSDDEAAFVPAAAISRFNDGLYRWLVQPLVQAWANEATAEALRQLHPLRVSRYGFSDLNPWMTPLRPLAGAIKVQRRPVSPDNPFLAIEKLFSDTLSNGLNLYRDLRDRALESWFYALLDNPWIGRSRPIRRPMATAPFPKAGRTGWRRPAAAALPRRW